MEEIVFYESWLPLDKKHFRLLAMLADKGNFQGSLAQICRNLSIASGQAKTNNSLKESIEYLTSNGFISCEHKGHTYTLRVIPKGKEVKINRQWAEDVLYVRGLAEGNVSWEVTLKVLLWVYSRNAMEMTTNFEISTEINASESSIVDAKNVLRDKFGSIWQEIDKYKNGKGEIRNRGQFLGGVAPWSRD